MTLVDLSVLQHSQLYVKLLNVRAGYFCQKSFFARRLLQLEKHWHVHSLSIHTHRHRHINAQDFRKQGASSSVVEHRRIRPLLFIDRLLRISEGQLSEGRRAYRPRHRRRFLRSAQYLSSSSDTRGRQQGASEGGGRREKREGAGQTGRDYRKDARSLRPGGRRRLLKTQSDRLLEEARRPAAIQLQPRRVSSFLARREAA